MFTHHPKNLPSLIEIMYTISILSVTLLLLISNRSFLRILLKAPKVTWKAVKTAAHLPSHHILLAPALTLSLVNSRCLQIRRQSTEV